MVKPYKSGEWKKKKKKKKRKKGRKKQEKSSFLKKKHKRKRLVHTGIIPHAVLNAAEGRITIDYRGPTRSNTRAYFQRAG